MPHTNSYHLAGALVSQAEQQIWVRGARAHCPSEEHSNCHKDSLGNKANAATDIIYRTTPTYIYERLQSNEYRLQTIARHHAPMRGVVRYAREVESLS